MTGDIATTGTGQGNIRQQQLVRMDGTVLVSFIVGPGQQIQWEPEPGMGVKCPCAGRVRVLPDGPWLVLAYFPDGWPGRMEPWPEDQDLSPAGPFSIDTGVFME